MAWTSTGFPRPSAQPCLTSHPHLAPAVPARSATELGAPTYPPTPTHSHTPLGSCHDIVGWGANLFLFLVLSTQITCMEINTHTHTQKQKLLNMSSYCLCVSSFLVWQLFHSVWLLLSNSFTRPSCLCKYVTAAFSRAQWFTQCGKYGQNCGIQ